MNALTSIMLQTLAQAPAAKKPDAEPSTPLFGSDGIIGPIQMVLIAVLIGLIVFWVIYKKKQRDQE
jgi:hypothetical protein